MSWTVGVGDGWIVPGGRFDDGGRIDAGGRVQDAGRFAAGGVLPAGGRIGAVSSLPTAFGAMDEITLFQADLRNDPNSYSSLSFGELREGTYDASGVTFAAAIDNEINYHGDLSIPGDFTLEVAGFSLSTLANGSIIGTDFTSTDERGLHLYYRTSPSRLLVLADIAPDGSTGQIEWDVAWTPVADTAYDICVERDGDTLRLYVDGVLLDSTTGATGAITFTHADGIGHWKIGDRNSLSGDNFAGTIAGARLTASALYGGAGYTPPTLPWTRPAGPPKGAAADGARTWFNYPVVHGLGGDAIAVCSVDSATGATQLWEYDLSTGARTLRAELPWLGYGPDGSKVRDDHNEGAILKLASGDWLSVMIGHTVPEVYVATASTLAGLDGAYVDVGATFANGQVPSPTFTYANLVELSDAIYWFGRSNLDGWGPSYATSMDGGTTWSQATRFIENNPERPYIDVVKNGADRIDLVVSSMNASESATSGCSLWHGYIQGGNVYTSDGTLLSALSTSMAQIAHDSLTEVWDGETVPDNRAWQWEINVFDGTVYILFAVFADDGLSGMYRRARWTGSAWETEEICTSGRSLDPSGQIGYTPGICFHPDSPDVVYAAREVDGDFRIWEVRRDSGGTWTPTQITFENGVHFRPVCCSGPNALTYCSGVYEDFFDYHTAIVAMPLPS